MKKVLVITAAILVVAVGSLFAAGQKEYPSRDITDVVVWSAGGGTDVLNRVIMAPMAKELGVNINVTNVTGGVAGSVGMQSAYSKPHDGYTIAGISESNTTAAVQGGWNKTFDVWYPFIVGGSPDIVSVNVNTPYKTLKELIDAAKAKPGSIRAGASGSGSIHQLNLLALEKGTGASFNFIPYTGSAPANNAALTGEVSVVVTSVAEQAQLIRGGKLRPLAVLVPDSFAIGDATVPSAFTTYPDLSKVLPLQQSIGFAVPADVPDNVKKALSAAFAKAMKSDSVQKWLKDNFYASSGLSGDAASKVFAHLQSAFSWTLWDMKTAKVDPATLNIPKP
jgi:tripartite-type tricarboxylate transporter receptor subunit TctC